MTPDRRLPRALRIAAGAVLALYPVAAGTLLLTTDGWAVNRLNVRIWGAVLGPLGLQEAIDPELFAMLANVVLFVPLFAALAVLWPRWWWVGVGAAVSAAVEAYQFSLPARNSDPMDVLANTVGAALGVALGLAVHRAAVRRHQAAVRPVSARADA